MILVNLYSSEKYYRGWFILTPNVPSTPPLMFLLDSSFVPRPCDDETLRFKTNYPLAKEL